MTSNETQTQLWGVMRVIIRTLTSTTNTFHSLPTVASTSPLPSDPKRSVSLTSLLIWHDGTRVNEITEYQHRSLREKRGTASVFCWEEAKNHFLSVNERAVQETARFRKIPPTSFLWCCNLTLQLHRVYAALKPTAEERAEREFPPQQNRQVEECV